jgi:predicted adenylyl cyclase CyaB
LPSNLELKAHCENPDLAVEKAIGIGASYIKTMKQTDTYFNIDSCKLKLREISGEKSELIYYNRQGEEKWQSDYLIADVNDSRNLKKILEMLFDVLVIVKKKRTLYLLENARIHIDQVEGLGSFLEFEVIIGDSEEEASRLLKKLEDHFAIPEDNILKKSYSDLLLEIS